jgi:membrane associated rhomboid family serine protease
MGIDSRDYLRSGIGPRPFGHGGRSGDVVKGLIIANVVVFVLQLLTIRTGAIEKWLVLWPPDVLERFQLWRLVTYAFCHDTRTPFHILLNMYILHLAGRRIQSYYGSREFLLFYLLAAAVSGACYVTLSSAMGGNGYALGASGAVTAVFIAYAVRHPGEVWYLLGILPVQVKWLCLLMIVFDLHPVLLELGGGRAASGVAHAAHLGGYLFGFLYEWNQWRIEGWLDGLRASRLRRLRRRTDLKVYDPDPEPQPLESRVDELLQKVYEQGEASLTATEREFLKDASRRYRSRL